MFPNQNLPAGRAQYQVSLGKIVLNAELSCFCLNLALPVSLQCDAEIWSQERFIFFESEVTELRFGLSAFLKAVNITAELLGYSYLLHSYCGKDAITIQRACSGKTRISAEALSFFLISHIQVCLYKQLIQLFTCKILSLYLLQYHYSYCMHSNNQRLSLQYQDLYICINLDNYKTWMWG